MTKKAKQKKPEGNSAASTGIMPSNSPDSGESTSDAKIELSAPQTYVYDFITSYILLVSATFIVGVLIAELVQGITTSGLIILLLGVVTGLGEAIRYIDIRSRQPKTALATVVRGLLLRLLLGFSLPITVGLIVMNVEEMILWYPLLAVSFALISLVCWLVYLAIEVKFEAGDFVRAFPRKRVLLFVLAGAFCGVLCAALFGQIKGIQKLFEATSITNVIVITLVFSLCLPALVPYKDFKLAKRDDAPAVVGGIAAGLLGAALVQAMRLEWNSTNLVYPLTSALFGAVVGGLFLILYVEKYRHRARRIERAMEKQQEEVMRLLSLKKELSHALTLIYRNPPSPTDYASVARSLETAAISDPKNLRLHLTLAWLRMRQEKTPAAIVHLQIAQSINDSDPEVHIVEGLLKRRMSASVTEVVEEFFRSSGFELTPIRSDQFSAISKEPLYSKWGQTLLILRSDIDVGKDEMDQVIQSVREQYLKWHGSPEGRIAFLVTRSQSYSAKKVRSAEKNDHRLNIIVLSYEEMLNALLDSNAAGAFYNIVAAYTGQTDLYDVSSPITNPMDFYGRDIDLANIGKLVSKGTPVGLFGLWRVGKTSLLSQLRQPKILESHLVARVDLRVHFTDQRELFRLILDDIEKDLVRKFGKDTPQRLSLLKQEGFDTAIQFRSLVVGLTHTFACGVVIAFDEIDAALPIRGNPNRHLQTTIESLLQLNQSQASIVPIVCGKQLDVLSELENRTRISFGSFKPTFLTPMTSNDCREMIRDIGIEIGLQWTEGGLDRLIMSSGGHPFLARQLSSTIYRERELRGKEKHLPIDESDVSETEIAYLEDPNGYMRIAVQSGKVDSTERQLLYRIASNKGSIAADLEATATPSEEVRVLRRLQNYGIIHNNGGVFEISGSYFRSWILKYGS